MPETGRNPQKVVHIKLTEEQKRQLLAFVKKSGDAGLDVSVTFKADLKRGTIAPATFLVGNAV